MNYFNNLFFKIAGVLIVVFSLLTIVYVSNSFRISEDYHNEITQRLNKDVASYIVEEVDGIYDGETIDKEQMGKLMHHVMALSPSTEVYLLDLHGKILQHVALKKVVKADRVDLTPVKKLIQSNGNLYIKGDDPREIGGRKIFSAAPIRANNELVGYMYTIVGGQDYDALAAANQSSYVRKLSTNLMLFALISALLISLLAIWYFTKNFTTVKNTVQSFANGDYKARINNVDDGEFATVAETFNNMADTIEKNIEELQSVDQLRKELIANISHDLRTPIASIQGYIETLQIQKETLSPQEKEKYMNIVVNNTNQLKNMVDDLFELSKLETNQKKFNPERVQLAELIQDVADKYRIIAREKGISINTIYSRNTPLVKADISLIDRALQNIIDNAIKFCHSGDLIQLEVFQEREDVIVKIEDNGEGIDEQELPHIFERYRMGKFVKKDNQGSGLGLAIVKKIMDLHNTTIQVESKENKGTSFQFSLPVLSKRA